MTGSDTVWKGSVSLRVNSSDRWERGKTNTTWARFTCKTYSDKILTLAQKQNLEPGSDNIFAQIWPQVLGFGLSKNERV